MIIKSTIWFIMVKNNKNKVKPKSKFTLELPEIRSTEVSAHYDLHSSLSDSIFKDSFDKFLGDRDVRRRQLNLKENVDAAFNRDSSLECSAINEAPDSSTTDVLRPYEQYICSTPNLKFSNVPPLNLNTSGISNEHANGASKNHSSDLFASYVQFEKSIIGSQTEAGATNNGPACTSQLRDESISTVIQHIETTHNTSTNDKALGRSITQYSLRSKGIPSFSRVAKRRKTKKPKKTDVEAMLQKENIEKSDHVSFCSNRNSTSKFGSIINEICQVRVQDCSPGEACEFKSFVKPQQLPRHNKFTRVLRDVKNCRNISKNSPKLINDQLKLDAKTQAISQFSEITSSALLIPKNTSVNSIISDVGSLKYDDDLAITNESYEIAHIESSSDSIKNVDYCSKKYFNTSDEESIFFRRLRNNQLRPRSNDENLSNATQSPGNTSSSELNSLDCTGKTQQSVESVLVSQEIKLSDFSKDNASQGSSHSRSSRSFGEVSSSFGNTSQLYGSHGSGLEMRSQEALSSIANSLNSPFNISLKLQSSCDDSQKSNFTSGNEGVNLSSITRQALLRKYVNNDRRAVRRSHRLKIYRKSIVPKPNNDSNELYGSHYESYLSANSFSRLLKNSATSLRNASQGDSLDGSRLSKPETIETNCSNNFERVLPNTLRKQRSDMGESQLSVNNSTKSNRSHYDSNASANSFAGFQVDSLISLPKDNISQVDSLEGSGLLQAIPTVEGYSFRRSLRKRLVNDHLNSNASQSSDGKNSTELYGSFHTSNASAVAVPGLQDASLTNLSTEDISQGERLSDSTLTKVQSSVNSNSNLLTMMELECSKRPRYNIVDLLSPSNEGASSANTFNVTERNKKPTNLTAAGSSEENVSTNALSESNTLTHAINESLKPTDNINMESTSNNNTNIDIVPPNLTNESTSTSSSAAIKQFKPSKILNDLRRKMFMNNEGSHATVSLALTSALEVPVQTATNNDVCIFNPDLNTLASIFPTSHTVTINQLMSPREEITEDSNKLNFVNVTKRKRKQRVIGASNLNNLPAIMESSAADLPESEPNSTCTLPTLVESIAIDLPENMQSSSCTFTANNDQSETNRFSVSLHSGKWRRALSMYRKHSLVRSAFLLEQTDVVSTNQLKISLSNESNRQTLRHSVSFNLSRDNFVDFNETSDRRGARRRRTSVVTPSIDVGRIIDLEFVSTYKARDTILRKCGQSEPLEFADIYSESALRQCRKIGEGVYGEVYMNKTDAGRAIVLKIIPIEGLLEVNGEPQKKFDEILSEIVIALQLSTLRNDKQYMTSSFAEVVQVRCVQGRYPNHLVDLWELYRDNYQTENDHPEIFTDDQLYIVFELANGGQDLEAFQFANALQSKSAFQQMALALAIAEEKLQFEHRDLHWGNILLSPTDDKFVNFKLNGNLLQIPSEGIKVTIIDYTLSRMLYEGIVLYNDLSNDEELFTAHGDYQFDIYRLMKSNLDNDWQRFEPFNNVLWLHYIIDKLINGARYKNTKSRKHRLAIEDLMVIRDEITNYKSAVDSVSNV